MPNVLVSILKVLGQVGLGLLTSLLTEVFLKRLIVILLEKLVKRTESDLDDQLLQEAKKAWNLPSQPLPPSE